jgi:hypothetical protein
MKKPLSPDQFAQKLVDFVATVTQLDPDKGELPNADIWRRNAEKLFAYEIVARKSDPVPEIEPDQCGVVGDPLDPDVTCILAPGHDGPHARMRWCLEYIDARGRSLLVSEIR